MRSLRTLGRRTVTNDSPVPLVSSRGGGGLSGGSAGASPSDLLGRYSAIPTLFSVVNRTATAVAALDWHLYRVPADGRRDPGEDREEVTTHAARDLLMRPNPFMTLDQLMEAGQQHLDLVGEAAIVVTKAARIPLEMWPVRPDRLMPVPHPTQYLAGWIYRDPDGQKIPLNVDEVIFLKMPNPSDPYRGMGPVQALLNDLDSIRYSAQWNRNFFLNSAEPGGVIELPTHLSDKQWDEFVSRWREQHQGVSRAHRVGVIEHGGVYKPRGFSMKDMQFTELREMGRDTIYEAYGISRATMGVTDGVNFAAAKAAKAQFAELLTVPRANRWRHAFNHQLLPMFEPPRAPGARPRPTVEFDYDSPVDADPEAENAERKSKAEAASIYITSGFNAQSVQESLGLPDMQYGTGEETDPDRELMVQLVTAAPAALGPLLLPILLPNVDFPEPEAPAPPPAGGPAPAPASGRDPFPDDRAPTRPRAETSTELAALGELWETALEQLLDDWPTATAPQLAELRRLITDAIDDGDLAALGALRLDSSAAAARLAESLTALARSVAALTATSAPVSLTATVPDDLDSTAAVVAALLAADLATAAGREALRLLVPGVAGAAVAADVLAYLAERSDAGPRAQIGGALTGAQNAARVDTMSSGPVGSLYADETLDGATCAPCRAAHGRFICTTEDLAPYRKLYTAMGGYVDCEGGVRCRGTVTGVWRPDVTDQPLIPEEDS